MELIVHYSLLLEHQQRRHESLEAEQVVAIGGDVDPVDDVLRSTALPGSTLALLLRQHLLLAGLDKWGEDGRRDMRLG